MMSFTLYFLFAILLLVGDILVSNELLGKFWILVYINLLSFMMPMSFINYVSGVNELET